jgi:hypothetical protein
MKKTLWHGIIGVAGCVDNATGNHLLLCALNKILKEFGMITSIVIDSKSKSIAIEAELKGEDRPVSIKIKGYRIEAKGEGSLIRIEKISFSREWMDAIARNYLADAKLSIPVSSELLEKIL